jgi:hypothetical protein
MVSRTKNRILFPRLLSIGSRLMAISDVRNKSKGKKAVRKRLRKKLGKKEFAPKPEFIALTKAVFGALDYGSSYQEFTDVLKNISSLRISSKHARALIEVLTIGFVWRKDSL